MSRYQYLMGLVRELRPKHVVEIGTWNGKRAVEFMAISNCYYTGFDLFDFATKKTDKAELNVKAHMGMVDVGKHIETAGFSRFCLVRGDTKETLKDFKPEPFDFAFIDGGHSVETIQNDYEWVSNNIERGGVIILDDYYEPEIVGFGCNFLADRGEVIPGDDRTSSGVVKLLKVQA